MLKLPHHRLHPQPRPGARQVVLCGDAQPPVRKPGSLCARAEREWNDGARCLVGEFQAAKFTILGFDVTDIRQEVTALQEKGIVCERYPGMRQDEIGIWHSPNGALVA
jgi:hypothetical protein